MRLHLWVLAFCALVAVPGRAAAVERFALVIGNDLGLPGEQPLRYAERDAERMAATLRDVGGFNASRTVLLQGEDADAVRDALITLNDRVRSESGGNGLLLVYFSGHADATSLHLGGTRVPFDELLKLVRGSAASLRVLVVDACRSGALTRVKGGRQVAPFAIPSASDAPAPEGFALLTASSSREDAQESDQLGASFFSHALVSGMRGAADMDGDGRVVLDEAYRFAYAATLRATSESDQGLQHPTFQFDMRGREPIELARPGTPKARQAVVRFPGTLSYMLFAGELAGELVAELAEGGRARSLTVPAGRYFVRARGPSYLLQGSVMLQAGSVTNVDSAALERVEYARLVRKGASARGMTHGPVLSASLRSGLPGARDPCLGVSAGYAFQLHTMGILPRVEWCESGYTLGALRAHTRELALTLSGLATADFGRLALAGGALLGAQLSLQRFDTPGEAPPRRSLAPLGALIGALELALPWGLRLGLEARAETYLLRLVRSGGAQPAWQAAVAGRGFVFVGKWF
jgi:uncharacterized caspase-like protein